MATLLRELRYGAIEIYNTETLGVGSYGKVCKAKCGQLPCAAKLLHDTMFQADDPGIQKFVERFEQECLFLGMIKHPNIVQFLRTFRDPQSRRLALLMELMDEGLTKFLERSIGPLPYHTQLNICHDVALALAYLHSNDIIHRDLSSNNVLLIGEGSRAKVTDFGMSKLVGLNPRMTPLTMCPGTLVYMPPEALVTPPRYSSKLDCFSHGVLTIQIATRQFPKPGDASKYYEDPKYPTGRVLVQFPETERRRRNIDLVEPDHPLLPIALHCLKDRDTERPSADELCGRLATLKCEPMYKHSVQHSNQQNMQQQLYENDIELQKVRQKSQEKDNALERARKEYEKLNASLEQIVADNQAALQAKTTEYESTIEHLRKEISELRQQLKQPKSVPHPTKAKAQPASKIVREAVSTDPVELKWRKGRSAPKCMLSYWGAAVGHGNTAYFSQGHHVYSYTVPETEWTKLKPCEYKYFGMAIVNDKLTTIGGYEAESNTTNSLLTLSESLIGKKWKKLLPPMPTERVRPAAVSTPTHLVVAGGDSGVCGGALCTVEALDLDTLQWSSASSSPKALGRPNMTLCGGHLYLSEHCTLFSCSVEEIVEPKRGDSVHVWTRLKDIPTPYGASLTSLKGHILAIGGSNGRTITGASYCYDENTNSWSAVEKMLTPRSEALAAALPSSELVVVGGEIMETCASLCNVTEIAY